MDESPVERETFLERVKKDYKLIKENMKVPVVWRYYLFWLLRGLKPQFAGLDFIQIKTVYNIDDLQYGAISFYTSMSTMIGIAVYHRFFKTFEMKSLYYIVVFIRIVSTSIDLMQARRLNL